MLDLKGSAAAVLTLLHCLGLWVHTHRETWPGVSGASCIVSGDMGQPQSDLCCEVTTSQAQFALSLLSPE